MTERKAMAFQPDYRNIEACARNRKPNRVPLYEHNISDKIMERMTGKRFAHLLGEGSTTRSRNTFPITAAFSGNTATIPSPLRPA